MSITSSDEKGSRHDADSLRGLSFPGVRSLGAGGVGGICSVLVGHPFDLVKVRLQTADRAVRKKGLDLFKSLLNGKMGIRVCQRLRALSRYVLMTLGYLHRRFRTFDGRDTNL